MVLRTVNLGCLLAAACGPFLIPQNARSEQGQRREELREEELIEMSIEELVTIDVVTPTKTRQAIVEAPSIISVVTREEIDAWGYKSVAEAIENVPGFYPIDDYVTVNFGVRGVSAGQRSYNRILKVLLNGQTVTFRPDGTHFLGAEFLPMAAVERIEIIRGPASAVYGANAYLAVINVITRQPADKPQALLSGRLGYGDREFLSGGELGLGAGNKRWQFLSVVGYTYLDRSGNILPNSSPLFDTFADRSTRHDLARPLSAFASAAYVPLNRFKWGAQVLYSRLDTFGEFLDFGTLSHANRLAQDNYVSRINFDWRQTKGLSAIASAGFSGGGPLAAERLNAGSASTRPRRAFGYQNFELSFEEHFSFRERDSFLAGADFNRDLEQRLSILTVNTRDQTESAPLGRQGKTVLQNFGAYGQAVVYPLQSLTSLGFTANLRYDNQNIYGDAINYRAGLVSQIGERVTAKMLAGSSYQAPNAFQLYAQPLYAGEVIGNPLLKPETARTLEGLVSVEINTQILASVNVYATRAENKIELVPVGVTNLQPQNTGVQDSIGAESELHWRPNRHRFAANAQIQGSEERNEDPFLGTLGAPASSYPRFIGGGSWQYVSHGWGTLGLRGKYVSARRATKSNILQSNQPYLFAPYYLANASWEYQWSRYRIQFQANNLLNTSFTEPGYRGIDFPGRRRVFVLAYTWEF